MMLLAFSAIVRRRKVAVRNTRKRASIVKNVRNYKFKLFRVLMRCFCLICFLNVAIAQSQSPSFLDFSYRIAMNRMDFFTGPGLYWGQKNIVASFALESGINRTVFQGTMFPRASTAFGYRFRLTNSLECVPLVNYSFSILRIGEVFHHWDEFYVGYRLNVGHSVKFFQESMIGSIQETFKINNSQHSFFNWGYFGSIGISISVVK